METFPAVVSVEFVADVFDVVFTDWGAEVVE